MSDVATVMAAEWGEAPEVLRRQTATLRPQVQRLVGRLDTDPPAFVVTCARGSSAHAATFGKHLIERCLGLAVGAAAPNIATIYRKSLRLGGQLFLAISQSGRSDDLVESLVLARQAGALTVAIVNDTESPLAAASEFVLPMAAGPERSVAATKSFVASLAALLHLTAAWSRDPSMTAALDRLPDRLAAAGEIDWTAAANALRRATSVVTIGRGPTLAIAREASLKLKETCNLHAEAFSGAEFLHGPVALVEPSYPVLLFMPSDEAAPGMQQLAENLRQKGAAVLIAGSDRESAGCLPTLPADHPSTDAVCLAQSFYRLAVRLAVSRGLDADRPRHLQKVTRTR